MFNVQIDALAKRSLSPGCRLPAAAWSILLFACVAIHAQTPMQGRDPSFTSPNAGSMSHESMSDGAGRIDPVEAARIQQVQKFQIRQSIAEDSTRLVQLAQQLSDQISHDQPDTLTQAELKKYAEIGKLAHKLKTEMKNYGTAGPQIQPLPGLVPNPDLNRKRLH
jgi:hypothetical protein